MLIDRGTYYEDTDYKPIIELDESSNIISIINCPYIPKFVFEGKQFKTKHGPDVVSTCLDEG